MTFIPGKSIVPVSGQTITEEDKEYLHRVVDRGWYTEYVECAKFERELCKLTGKKYAVLTNSGSSASLIAITTMLKMYNIRCVLTPAVGFPTTVAPIYQNGREPIYIDMNVGTLEPNYDQLREALEYWLCAKEHGLSVITHTLGFPFQDFHPVFDGSFMIADCCDALGAEIKYGDTWGHVGRTADMITLSFFPAHHITTGEGGAVLTDNKELYDMARSLVNWGRDCWCEPGQVNTCGNRFDWSWNNLPEGWDHKYTFTDLGYNLKMTEFQAALGNSQIKRLQEFKERRQENYQYLRDNLVTAGIFIPDWSDPNPFGFPIFSSVPNKLIAFLEEHKIQTRRFFGGNLSKQPAFENLHYSTVNNYPEKDLEGSDFIMENGFWIGCHPQLTREMLDYVLEIFGKFYNE